MPQISRQELERLPLRVHDFLAGVPLHDVWAVDLPRIRSGITLAEFLRAAGARPFTPSPLVRALLNIRFFVGRLLGWDREPDATLRETFATRLTTADLSKSLAPTGTREGAFRIRHSCAAFARPGIKPSEPDNAASAVAALTSLNR